MAARWIGTTKEGDLSLGRELSDFIEEDRAPFGQLKAPEAKLNCPCKRALLIAIASSTVCQNVSTKVGFWEAARV